VNYGGGLSYGRACATYDVSLLDAEDGFTEHEAMCGVADDARVGQIDRNLVGHLLSHHNRNQVSCVVCVVCRVMYAYLHFVEARHPDVALDPRQEAEGLVIARPVVDVEAGQTRRYEDLTRRNTNICIISNKSLREHKTDNNITNML
jgi:hypothetical protein